MICIQDLADVPQACVATIGFFDGVHKGHQYLIQQLKDLGNRLNLPTLVITFAEHPRRVLKKDYRPLLLNTYAEKQELLQQLGIDYLYSLPFSKEMSKMTSYEFMRQILVEQLNVRSLLVGYDHHFGSDVQTSVDDYQKMGIQLGLQVVEAQEWMADKVKISSSKIRENLQKAQVAEAAQMLGYYYAVSGLVEHGKGLGRRMGFPTANVSLQGLRKMLPEDGVYACRAWVGGQCHVGVANLGRRPTIVADGERSLEVHLLAFNQEIYGKEMRVEFVQFLRKEKRFDSLALLSEAMRKDSEQAKTLITI